MSFPGAPQGNPQTPVPTSQPPAQQVPQPAAPPQMDETQQELARLIGDLIGAGNALTAALASIDVEELEECLSKCGYEAKDDLKDLIEVSRDIAKIIRKFYKLTKKMRR